MTQQPESRSPYAAPQVPAERPGAYRTTPPAIDGYPPGVPYIVGNEAAERFSYYGMRGILVVFMSQYLLNSAGQAAPMSETDATLTFHLFMMATYCTPILGALLADAWLGKYKTILALSIFYCLGHLALALDETRLGLMVGLSLIALGAGGIKPCVSAHVGDQFGRRNAHLLDKVFGWFYFALNLGAAVSTLLIPWLLQHWGPRVAFGVPGVLMVLATWVFWLGRNKFVHVPAEGSRFVRDVFSRQGLLTIARLSGVFLFVSVFWALYDQTGSTWVFQAGKMDCHLFGVDWLPSQVQTINPILILLFVPLFTYVIYPAVNKVFPLTPIRKIAVGFFIAAISFLIPAYIEKLIAAGQTPTVAWQLLAYVVITASEVMVSTTFLEFSYRQAPAKMKSIVMAMLWLSVSLGNFFTYLVNLFINNADGTTKLDGPQYFLLFAGAMFLTAMAFVVVAFFFKEETHMTDEGTEE